MGETKRQIEESLFEAAANIADAAERTAFLARSCHGDPVLRERLELLLEGHFQAEGFLTRRSKLASTPAEPPLPEVPPVLSGRYRLVERIGEGGFGEVWLAEQQEPVRRRVAVKILKLGMDTRQVVRRFEAERQTIALMDHPNIARVLDAGATDTGRPYFVMDLVRGCRITEYCDQHHLPTGERLELFIQVCQAIEHAHQKGIIHRDIKPSNILVTLQDGAPVPKVIDFGIAKATQADLPDLTLATQHPQFLGTPSYVSPEQAERGGVDIDTRSDIYSLGVLLYELLTGKTPFEARELTEGGLDTFRQIIREREPARPSSRLRRLATGELTATAERRQTEAPRLIHLLKGDLDWVVMKCLEKDRRRRYATADALVRDLRRQLNQEPVAARPPSARYRLEKFVRRNRVLVGAAGGVVAALLLGLVGSVWQASVATRARATAERQLYAAQMNLAQREWEQNNAGRVRQLLEETQAYPDRGFEWYYWQRQTHLDLLTFRAHAGRVGSLAYSPDGRRILSGNTDGRVSRLELEARVWDADDGQELLTLEGHQGGIVTVAFSPDGDRMVTGSADTTAKVWDATSGQQVLTLSGDGAKVWSVAFSPDGRRIATASWDHAAKVWDAVSGQELLSLAGHQGPVFAVAFSPDGRLLVTGSLDATAKVWDATNGKERLTLRGHTNMIRAVAFSPDGSRILTASHDRTAKVWDVTSGQLLLTLQGHTDMLRAAKYSPDGRRVVTASADRTARVWDATNGLERLALKGHASAIRSVAFSPDGQRIATGGEDGIVKVWAARDPFLFSGHSGPVLSVAFSPDGQRVITGGDDRIARVWEVATGAETLVLQGHRGPILTVGFFPDGRKIVTGSWDQTVQVWEAETGRELFTFGGAHGGIRSLAISRDGGRIVTASWDQVVRVWDGATGRELRRIAGHPGGVAAVALSPDGERLLTGGEDGLARLWEAGSGRELLTFKGHTAGVNAVAFSPDGRRILTGSADTTARVWTATRGRSLFVLKGHTAAITSTAFSPDGRRMVTGSEDRTAKMWDAATGGELTTFSGHRESVLAVAFSGDGQRIVTGSVDSTARVWEAATARQVAAWESEEQAGNERVAARWRGRWEAAEADRARRAEDPGAIKQWLVLAPIPYQASSSLLALVDTQLPDEATLRPRAGERVTVGGVELEWAEVRLADSALDLARLLGAPHSASVAYAVCYLHSQTHQTDLRLHVSGVDLVRVYINGDQVYRDRLYRGRTPAPDVVTGVSLNAGLNVLVFKILVEVVMWEGSIWLTTSDGSPIPGLRVTLDREEELGPRP